MREGTTGFLKVFPFRLLPTFLIDNVLSHFQKCFAQGRGALRPLPHHSLFQINPDTFDFCIVFKGVRPHFTAESGLFVTAERRSRIGYIVAIDPHRPGL